MAKDMTALEAKVCSTLGKKYCTSCNNTADLATGTWKPFTRRDGQKGKRWRCAHCSANKPATSWISNHTKGSQA